MEKQVPTLGRLLTMVVFALSCFGLLLFLWLSFGGAVPLKPKGYRFEVAFPEATTLAVEANVQAAGVPIGRVKQKRLDRATSRTLVTIEVDRDFAPLRSDARAILRQRSLLGETYVEITPGSRAAPALPEGSRLRDGRVAATVELDEIFDALDPGTRAAFRTWQRELARALNGRGRDVSDAVGTLPGFEAAGTDVFAILDEESTAVRGLVRDTGAVFSALTEREGRLGQLVSSAANVFEATASSQDALAESIGILPTFLDESRATLRRVESFARHADPLVRDLAAAARDLRPTLDDVRLLAPRLSAFAADLDALVHAADPGLPAGTDLLDGLAPLLRATGPFLSELNPVLEWLEYNQALTVGFFDAPVALADTIEPQTDQEVGHYLRSLAPMGLESLGIWQQRLPSNRGNAYLSPVALRGPLRSRYLITPSWDCKNTGRGEFMTRKGGTNDDPSCYRTGYPGWLEEPGVFPRIERADYSRP